MGFNILNVVSNEGSLVDIEAGIQGNIFIKDIDLEKRTNRSTGEQINRNTYVTLVQLDDAGEEVAQRTINWGDVDPTKNYAYNVYCRNVAQMVSILECFYTKEEVRANFNIFKGYEDTVLSSDLTPIISDRMESDKLTDQLGIEFKKLLEPFFGNKEHLMKIVLVFDDRGQNVNLSSSVAIAERNEVKPEDSILKLTKRENDGFKKAEEFKATMLKEQGIEETNF